MAIPIYLILEIVKYTKFQVTIINFSLINEDTYINKDYLGILKLKELGLKGGNFDIYNKITNVTGYGYDILIQKNKIICYSHILVCSSQHGLLNVVKFLVESGAKSALAWIFALRYSAEKGHLEVVKFLVSQGADIHAESDIALTQSAGFGHLKVVKYLVSQGANIHARDDWTLKYAAIRGHLEVVKFLVESGVDIHQLGPYYTTNIVPMKGKIIPNSVFYSIKTYLIECGVDIDKNRIFI